MTKKSAQKSWQILTKSDKSLTKADKTTTKRGRKLGVCSRFIKSIFDFGDDVKL